MGRGVCVGRGGGAALTGDHNRISTTSRQLVAIAVYPPERQSPQNFSNKTSPNKTSPSATGRPIRLCRAATPCSRLFGPFSSHAAQHTHRALHPRDEWGRLGRRGRRRRGWSAVEVLCVHVCQPPLTGPVRDVQHTERGAPAPLSPVHGGACEQGGCQSRWRER